MDLKQHSILVAGGSGFIGSNLISRLLDMSCDVRTTTHVKAPQLNDDRVEYLHCDLMKEKDCLFACKDMDVVFLCAANTSGAAVIQNDPLSHVTPNVMINSRMLDAAYKCGVKKFVFISSNVVYPPVDFAVKEDDYTGQIFSKYFCVGWMKRFSEILCEMYACKIPKPMSTLVVRPANLYGEYDDFNFETAHVIPSLIRKIVEHHDPLEVWGDGHDLKDFLYIGDFIDGLISATEQIDDYICLNLSSGVGHTIRDIIKTLCEIEKWTPNHIEFDIEKPTMIPKRLVDSSLAGKLINFKYKTDLISGLTKTIEWYKKCIQS